MAAIQNLEIVVDVDISQALAKLTKLQDELRDLAQQIEAVDAQGAEGIDIRTNVRTINDDLAQLQGQIEAFEQANRIDLATNVDGDRMGGKTSGKAVSTVNILAQEARIISAADIEGDIGFGGSGGGGGGAAAATAAGGVGVSRGASAAAGAIPAHTASAAADSAKDAAESASRLSKIANNLEYLPIIQQDLGSTIDHLGKFKIRMATMHNLLAAIMPMLAVFVGALPIAITGLITLAGAAVGAAASLAAIAGLGAMGYAMGDTMEMPGMEDFEDIMERIKEDFFEAFAPLAQQLSPVFADALDGLEMFFQRIANQGDALMNLTDMARDFGQFMIEWIPGLLRTFSAGIQAMEPVFSQLADWLRESNLVETFTRQTLESIDALRRFTGQIINFLSLLVELSQGFIRVWTSLATLIGFLYKFMTLGGRIGDETMGLLIGSLLGVVSVMSLLGFVIRSMYVVHLVNYISMLKTTITTLLLKGQIMGSTLVPIIAKYISAIYTKIAALMGYKAAQLSAAKATLIAAGALASFLTLVSLGGLAVLIAGAAAAANHFFDLADGIGEVNDEMREFNDLSAQSEGNPYGDTPDSGAGTSGFGGGTSGGGGDVFMESSGDPQRDRSNQQKGQWLQSRSSGSGR